MPAPVAVGVDNGGTWIRLKGLNADGRCVWTLKKPSPSVEALPAFLRKHLQLFHGNLSALAVGSRALWKPSKRRAVKRALRGLAKHIVVMSDVEAAWMAAFASPVGRKALGVGRRKRFVTPHAPRPTTHGIIVVAGTGSIAYGRKADGTIARAGGLGPEKGDEGSGYWIGKEWMRRRPVPSSRRKPGSSPMDWAPTFVGVTSTTVRQIASLAPLVIRRAKEGNLIAREITHDAQRHLSRLVIDLIQKLQWTGIVPFAVSGSVLDNPWFQRGYFKTLKKDKIKFRFVRNHTDQAVAALLGLSIPWQGARRAPQRP